VNRVVNDLSEVGAVTEHEPDVQSVVPVAAKDLLQASPMAPKAGRPPRNIVARERLEPRLWYRLFEPVGCRNSIG
jgi:hypothetical protein